MSSLFSIARVSVRPIHLTTQRLLVWNLRRLCSDQNDLMKRIEGMVKGKRLVLFMKGTPEAPRCGFSNAVCQLLDHHGITDFNTHDVLQNDEIREGIKEYSKWPTIPQVFINGEFVGGCDIMFELHKTGEIIDEFRKAGLKSRLEDLAPKPGEES